MINTAQGSVLGITDFGPVGGTPLVPPSYLTVYFVGFLLILTALYAYFQHRRRPVVLWHRIRLLIVLAFALKLTLVAGGSIVAAYWLIPTPQIRRTIPQSQINDFSPTSRIEIVFDRPIDRNLLEKSISPEVPGRWVFENSLYTTHLYRKLVFYPTFSLKPDTEYKIKLSGIRNMIKISDAYNYEFSFKTQSSPKVSSTEPAQNQGGVARDTQIKVNLSTPNNHVSEFNFEFEPAVEHDYSLDQTSTTYTIIPKNPLRQGTTYKLKVKKSDVILNLETTDAVERAPSEDIYETSFTTIQAPGVASFVSKDGALVDSDIEIVFNKNMDSKSVEENFSIIPDVSGRLVWDSESHLTFNPSSLDYDTEYKVIIAKGAKSQDGAILEEDVVNTFRTIGPVKIASTTPNNGWSAVNIHSPIKITFDQEVDRASTENNFSISPSVHGGFSWDGNTMIFTPDIPLEFTTEYAITLATGIASLYGLDSSEEFNINFKTQDATTRLAVPAYLQKYSLSCEMAALRMALAFKGVDMSEDTLLAHIGVDNTPHNGNVWGNPYNAFVGNVRGRQMADGYGVYWGPIARAARNYRSVTEFQGWSIEQLTREIENGNPVVIWVYSSYGTPTSWNTPDGQHIYAVRDEHAVTAVGFVGPAKNPTQMIINDPLVGQVYWSRAKFDRKWNIFGQAGVVVY